MQMQIEIQMQSFANMQKQLRQTEANRGSEALESDTAVTDTDTDTL